MIKIRLTLTLDQWTALCAALLFAADTNHRTFRSLLLPVLSVVFKQGEREP